MERELTIYFDHSAILRGLPANNGIDEALDGLGQLRSRGVAVKIVDTAGMSEDEIQGTYLRATQPSVRQKYSVRQMFGSRRRSGWLFGRAVPAMVVWGASGEAVDVFPHDETGRIVTICDALNSF
jgi:hypothetical protein